MTLAISDITGSLFNKWWLTDTVTEGDVAAIYQPVYAKDLTNSYIDLNDIASSVTPGVAPTFIKSTGWEFDGVGDYLKSGISPTGGTYTMIAMIDLSDNRLRPGVVIGSSAANAQFSIRLIIITSGSGINVQFIYAWANGNRIGTIAYDVPSKLIVVLAGSQPYYVDDNGDLQSFTIISSTFSGTAIELYIGALNTAGSPGLYWNDNIQAVAFYDRVLTQAEVQIITSQMLEIDNIQTHIPDVNFITIHPNTKRFPQSNHILLLAMDSGLYRSENGGIGWSKLELPNPGNREFEDSPAATVDELTFNWIDYDPTNADVIYALAAKDSVSRVWIYKSTDNGLNWISRGVITV